MYVCTVLLLLCCAVLCVQTDAPCLLYPRDAFRAAYHACVRM